MNRQHFLKLITDGFAVHPIIAILGPRQVGKTTLARQYINPIDGSTKTHYFELEDPNDLSALKSLKAVLEPLEGLIVIDEIQRITELFPLLMVLVEKPGYKQRYLILDSASQELIRESSETLAGRIVYIELTPFQYEEVKNLETLWIRGGVSALFFS